MKKIVLGLGIAAFMMIGGVGASYALLSSNDAPSVLVEKEKEKDKKKNKKGKKEGCCSSEKAAKCEGEKPAKCEGEKPAGKSGCCAGKKGA